MLGGDIQWDRYAEVAFTNFNSGLVTTIKSSEIDNDNNVIGDGLRIAFEYKKSDDQGYNTPNGKIVIYGLTEKTFNAVGERLRAEVEVKAGYLKSKKNAPKRLFYAVLMNKKYEIQAGISVSTFEVLGDFIERAIAHKMSLNLPKPTLIDIMKSIATALNKGAGIKLNGTPEEDKIMIDYLHMWRVSPFGYSFAGTPQQELKRLKDSFGITYRIEGDNMVFSIADSWFDWHMEGARQIADSLKQRVNTSLVAENKVAPEVVDNKTGSASGAKIDLQRTHALVLSPDTGLIGSPTMTNKIATTDYDAALGEGEEVWSKKEQTVVVDKKTGEAKKDKEGNIKMTKKAKTKKVDRKTCNARCFINSALTFNSQVSIITESGVCDGVYRVRSIKISGDTEGNDWYMELELNE